MQQFAGQEIGARIAQARHEAGGMTQEELAEALNVSKRSVQDYEAGVTIPWKHFQRLEQIFKRPIDWFLHGGEEPSEDRLAQVLREELEPILQRLREIEALLQDEGPPPEDV